MKNPIKWERGENVVKLFPTLVVDDFLNDPDYVYNLAKNAEYKDPPSANAENVARLLPIPTGSLPSFATRLSYRAAVAGSCKNAEKSSNPNVSFK